MKSITIMTIALCLSTLTRAQDVAKPVDRKYPGVIELQIDATNVTQKIYKVHERIPVKSGAVTLLYPQWLLGAHAPADSSLAQFAGLTLSAGQRRIEWRRDPLDMHAFHATVPAGVSALDADFEFLSPLEGSQGAILAAPEMAVHWETLLLYPAGYYARGIMVQATVTLPENWQFAGRARTGRASGRHGALQGRQSRPSRLARVCTGKNFQRIDLDPGAKVPVFLNMVADSPENLQATTQQIDAHRALVQQAYKLFGSHRTITMIFNGVERRVQLLRFWSIISPARTAYAPPTFRIGTISSPGAPIWCRMSSRILGMENFAGRRIS